MCNCNAVDNSYIHFEDFKNIVEEGFIDKGDRVILNGGEPTLNPDLIKILEYCNKIGTETILFTNGRKLNNSENAKRIIQSNVSKITIPFYGHNAEIHNQITRNQNSFHETVAGLKNLNRFREDITNVLELKILICRDNYKYIKDIAEYLITNYNFDNLLLSGLIPSDVAIKNNQTVPKEWHMEAVNNFFDYFWKCKERPSLIIDGIPLCHLNERNRMLYLLYRKTASKYDTTKVEKNYYIDVSDINNIVYSQEIQKWNKSICINTKCKYLSICRLNTLLNHKTFLREWINE
jgi:Predicted Fe-S oxidoreductases